MNTMKLWAVHSDTDAPIRRSEISFDWPAMGDMSALAPEREAFRQKFDAAYPDENAANRSAVAGALYRLVHEMAPGDYVACLHGETVSVGTVSGPYAFRDNAHTRPVEWRRHIPQSEFSRDAMREVTCSPVRLFPVKRFAGEFLGKIGVAYVESEAVAKRPAVADAAAPAETPSVPVRRPADADTRRFVLNALRKSMTREDFRKFAAGLLRAMGYTISLPPYGGLNEFEMTARRDDLFPPVLVQTRGTLEETDVVRLREAVEPGAYGLVFTLQELSERTRAALRQSPYLRVVTGEELASLTLNYYGQLDDRYRALIPLRMTYVPSG